MNQPTCLQFYQFSRDIGLHNADAIELLTQCFAERTMKPLAASAQESFSFAPVHFASDDLIHAITDNAFVFNVCHQKKPINSKALKASLIKLEDALKEKEGRDLTKKEKATIKEAEVARVLSITEPVIETFHVWVFDDALCLSVASATKRAAILQFVRKSIGTLPIAPLESCQFIETVSEKLSGYGEAMQGFDFGSRIVLKGRDKSDTPEISFKNVDLHSPEVIGHLDDMAIALLELELPELTFDVTSELLCKRLRWPKSSEPAELIEDAFAAFAADAFLVFAQIKAVFNCLTCFNTFVPETGPTSQLSEIIVFQDEKNADENGDLADDSITDVDGSESPALEV